MLISTRGAFLAGASPISFAPERKDTAALTTEVKTAVDQLSRIFEEFKSKNDERLKQVEKKAEDVVSAEQVDRINTAIDEAKSNLTRRLDEMEAKANRLALGGGGTAVEAKQAAEFGELLGQKGYDAAKLAEYKSDLGTYLRRGEAKATTLMVGSDPAGGYWVTPDASGRMVAKIYETTPMRQLANVVSIGTDRLEGPIDNGEADALWVGETDSRPQTSAAQIGMWGIDVNELMAYPMVTQKLLEDGRIDVEAWIANKAASKFARRENAAFVNGDGVRKPKGFLQYTAVATDDATRPWGQLQYVPSGKADGFAATNPADCFIDMIYAVKAGYRQGANFISARKTLGQIRKLKDGQGNYLVDLRLRDGALVETIFGYAVADGEDMPQLGANTLPLAFGNFAEAYTIVDRLGTSVIRDNITVPGFVKFHMRRRTGGGMVNFEALKLLKIAAS
ncbi:MAG TPA: phage major capsid protein [Novosphingobium sp.]|nr:phage major capsid protein [Novosphingobium sp.]